MPGRSDHQIRMSDIRFLQNCIVCAISGVTHYIIAITDLVHNARPAIDDRNIMSFAAKVLHKCLADLTAAYNYDFHTLDSSGSLTPS